MHFYIALFTKFQLRYHNKLNICMKNCRSFPYVKAEMCYVSIAYNNLQSEL